MIDLFSLLILVTQSPEYTFNELQQESTQKWP